MLKLLQSCLTLCNPMVRSPPSSSVSGILQARILEWVAMPSSRARTFQDRILEWIAMPSSRASSQLRDQTASPALQANSLPLSHLIYCNCRKIASFFFFLIIFHKASEEVRVGCREMNSFVGDFPVCVCCFPRHGI